MEDRDRNLIIVGLIVWWLWPKKKPTLITTERAPQRSSSNTLVSDGWHGPQEFLQATIFPQPTPLIMAETHSSLIIENKSKTDSIRFGASSIDNQKDIQQIMNYWTESSTQEWSNVIPPGGSITHPVLPNTYVYAQSMTENPVDIRVGLNALNRIPSHYTSIYKKPEIFVKPTMEYVESEPSPVLLQNGFNPDGMYSNMPSGVVIR